MNGMSVERLHCAVMRVDPGALGRGAGYPTKEINYTIAFNPAGESDIEFRIMQPFLEKAFGVRFVPDTSRRRGGRSPGILVAAAPTVIRSAASMPRTSSPSRSR